MSSRKTVESRISVDILGQSLKTAFVVWKIFTAIGPLTDVAWKTWASYPSNRVIDSLDVTLLHELVYR